MMNVFQQWFIRAMKLPKHDDHLRESREFEKTLDDHETNSPARRKQALRKAPERK